MTRPQKCLGTLGLVVPYTIRTFGDPVLKQRAKDVTDIDGDLLSVVDTMFETMYEARGVGLAAPQVGISLRVFVVDCPEDPEDPESPLFRFVAVNPEILAASGEILSEEGCLSMPGVRESVKRHERVQLAALDADGKRFEITAGGLVARAIQHEMDHLDGRLFVDRLRGIKRDLILRKIRKLSRSGQW